jgi:D-alanyl-D-alanine carboxypeptidase
MDFFIQTILILAVLAGFNNHAFGVENFAAKAKADVRPEVSLSPHPAPALRVLPYLSGGAPELSDADFTAKSAIVMDEGTGRILFQKDATLLHPIASLTKLMSALVWFDVDGDLNKIVKISAADYREGSIPYFVAGDKVKTKDLLYSALVASSNSAVAALVRSTGLPEEKFVSFMNAKAEELGMENTKFFDPIGLSAKNESTAVDLFILARESFYNPEISRATQLVSYEFSPAGSGAVRIVRSTDLLLTSSFNAGDYKIIGGKTGYIEESDYNLILKIYNKEKNKNIIAVILGSGDKNSRFSEAKKLIEWTYANYQWEI